MNEILSPEEIIILSICGGAALFFLCAAIRSFYLWYKTPVQIGKIIGYQFVGPFSALAPVLKFQNDSQTEIKNIISYAPEGTKLRLKPIKNKHMKLSAIGHLASASFCFLFFSGLIYSEIDDEKYTELADLFFFLFFGSILAFLFLCLGVVIMSALEAIQFTPHRHKLKFWGNFQTPYNKHEFTKQDFKTMKSGDIMSYKKACAYHHYRGNKPVAWLILIIALIYFLHNAFKLLN